jgi:CheY-like chemotaxis protein
MRRILFVDDDFAVAEITRMVLEHEGFAVTIASNGEDALAATASETFDLVITDYMMPIMNGAELVRRMRETPALADLPVIMITATPTNELANLKLSARPLSKPITVDQLLLAIETVLGRD